MKENHYEIQREVMHGHIYGIKANEVLQHLLQLYMVMMHGGYIVRGDGDLTVGITA